MHTPQRVALVTGGNRGLGFETARQLAAREVSVVLASRERAAGERAARRLADQGLRVSSVLLDVTDETHIGAVTGQLDATYGRLDILINNAGIMLDSSGPDGKQASVFVTPLSTMRESLETNALAPLRLCQALVPLMRRHGYGRIVNVASEMGQLSTMRGQYPGYKVSKTALNALTRILADELDGTNLKVNSACPGWVRTDLGGPDAVRSPEQGADTIVWLATLPDDGPSGGFFRDRLAVPW